MHVADYVAKRNTLHNDMQAIIDAGTADNRNLTAEEAERYDKLEKDFDSVTADLRRAESAEKRTAEMRKITLPDSITNPAAGESATRKKEAEAEYREAFGAFLRRGVGGITAQQAQVIQTRALAEGTGSTGGYLVPQGFYTQIVETLKTFGTLLNVATVLHTPLGNALPIPTMDDTSNEGVIVPENGSIPELGATFGQKTLGAYKFSSNIVRVSYELLNDSASVVLPQVNDGYSTGAASGVEGIINDISGERIGRIMDHKYTVGAGTTEPMGIVNAVTAFTTGATGQTTSIIYDNLIDLQYSVDKAYRNAAGWMLNDLSIAAIRKLKDTQGHPLWQPALTAGAPDLLLGYPVQTNNYVPVMAANAVSVLFGDFRRYYIRIVDQVIAQRLTERYADFGQVGFLILMRADGNLMDTSAVKAYKNSAT